MFLVSRVVTYCNSSICFTHVSCGLTSSFVAECLLIVSCHVTASLLRCSLAGLLGCGLEHALLAFDAAVLARLPLLCIAGGPGQACKYLEMLELLASPRESGGSRRIIFYDQACALATALLLA